MPSGFGPEGFTLGPVASFASLRSLVNYKLASVIILVFFFWCV